METYELSFGIINILRDDLAEIIINDGIEVSADQVDEANAFLVDFLEAPFSLLFNKKNQYSFHYDAQIKLGTFDELNAIAVLCYSKTSSTITEVLSNVPRASEWNMQTFFNREEALAWIENEQTIISQKQTL